MTNMSSRRESGSRQRNRSRSSQRMSADEAVAACGSNQNKTRISGALKSGVQGGNGTSAFAGKNFNCNNESIAGSSDSRCRTQKQETVIMGTRAEQYRRAGTVSTEATPLTPPTHIQRHRQSVRSALAPAGLSSHVHGGLHDCSSRGR